MVQLIPAPHKEALLGGLLRFVGYRATLQLLREWASEHRHLRRLAELSEHLADFPDLAVPSTSQPIHRQFDGQLETHYLAVQFATRRAPGLSAREQLQITCLRTWILLRALQFADDGHRADRSLRHLCTQLRMALDDRDSGKKLRWFLDVAEPALTLQQFELSLRFNVHRQTAGDASSTTDESIRSIQALLDHHPRPEKRDFGAEITLPGDGVEAIAAAIPSGGLLDGLHASGVLYLPPDEVEDELQFQETVCGEDATPPQVVRESRGIVFQSQEDQQYLPFAWNRLRPDELIEIKNAIRSKLMASDPAERLLAAVTVVALITRRSLETVESLCLATVPAEEWQLDPAMGRLHRQPSRRVVRWRADDLTQEWIRPLANAWELQLHLSVQAILQAAHQSHPEARFIGQLWTGQRLTLASAFNSWCAGCAGLARVSSGLLVRVSEQAAFEQTLDMSFSRLLTSPARSGIPGSGAYPSWSHGQVAQVMNQIGDSFATMAAADPDRNGLGSELDPDDGLLAGAMAQAWDRLCSLANQPERWLEYHNHLASYGVLMLLAATGARPVTSVFQSASQFDTHQGQAYLEDKVARTGLDGTAGRLVPLVQPVMDFLAGVYYPHLRHLAEGLRPQLPALAAELERQASGAGSDRLPLFFLFRHKPEFDWIELSESSLRSLGLLAWPLPLNLFRHRLASRLRSLGLDPELVDAQLGHAEAGSETYGHFSPRCWETDEPAWRGAVACAFDQLNIQRPVLARHAIASIPLAPGYQPFSDESLFGQAARAQERAKRRDAAASRALEEIKTFVGTRPVDSIPTHEWERLGRQMLLTENNLRQANAAVRYQVYESYLQRQWREHGQRPRLKKWLARMPAPQSAFRAEVIGVTARLDAVRTALDAAHLRTHFPPSSPGIAAGARSASRSTAAAVSFGQSAGLSPRDTRSTAGRVRPARAVQRSRSASASGVPECGRAEPGAGRCRPRPSGRRRASAPASGPPG